LRRAKLWWSSPIVASGEDGEQGNWEINGATFQASRSQLCLANVIMAYRVQVTDQKEDNKPGKSESWREERKHYSSMDILRIDMKDRIIWKCANIAIVYHPTASSIPPSLP
jgi:hypothetical protein